MTVRKLKGPFLRVVRPVAEALARLPVSGLAHRVIWAILRMTWGDIEGGAPKVAPLSARQLADMTGASRAQVAASVAELVRVKVLREETAPGYRQTRVLGLEKRPSLWEPIRQLGQSGNPDSPGNKTVREPGQSDTGGQTCLPIPDTPVSPSQTLTGMEPAPQAGFESSQSTESRDVSPTEIARASRRARSGASSDRRVTEFKATYAAKYREAFGRELVLTNHGQVGKLAKGVLAVVSLEELAELIPHYFALSRSDRFFKGAPIERFLDGATVNRLRELHAAAGNGNGTRGAFGDLWASATGGAP